MKSTSKMMVIATVFLVAAAMLVFPAAAVDQTVSNGGTIFDYEVVTLNSDLGVPGDYSQIAQYTDDEVVTKQAKGFSISVPEGTGDKELDLTAIDMGGHYGTYFPVYTAGGPRADYRIYIREPKATLDVVLDGSRSDSISGKTVTKSSAIAFRVDAPDVGNYLKNKAQVAIELTTPGHGKIRVVGNSDYRNLNITGTRMYVTLPVDDLKTLESGTYTAQALWTNPQGFDDYAKDSNTVSFTLSSKTIAVSSNKESVVRNNPFVITLTGDSKTNYYLYIKDASVTPSEYPTIKAGQSGVTILNNAAFSGAADSSADNLANNQRATYSNAYVNATAAVVNTKADGTRTIEFGTDTNTNDKTYTLKVVDPSDSSKYDEVKVSVEKGEVTITSEGTGTYYLGEEIKLSGTNTDSDNVYLFMTGPNLGDQDGVALDNVSAPASDGNYVERDVESDDTWSYRWDTSNLAATGSVLDAGTYTVYAVSNKTDDKGYNVDKTHLSGIKYKTFAVQLKQAFVTAQATGTTLAKGDEFKITGTAEGQPDSIHIWIFGKNYRNLADSASVEDDGSFEYTLERADTQNLATGQYFAIVQHPMTDGVFNVKPIAAPAGKTGSYWIQDGTENPINLGRLAASDAATALVDALNSANCDDTYAKLSFSVQEAWIAIDSIGDKSVGSQFAITGTTNLAVGDDLTVTVTSGSFGPTQKTQSDAFSGDSGTVQVTEGADYNKWSFDADASDWKIDQYSVQVESVDADVSTSAQFNVVEGPVTTPVTPTQSVTTVPTTQSTTTVPPTTTPTQPGFGALISLIGLGAVAFLVMRRN